MIFLVQFEINKHSQIFQRLQIFVVFEKFARAYLFQIALEIIWLPIQILLNYKCWFSWNEVNLNCGETDEIEMWPSQL